MAIKMRKKGDVQIVDFKGRITMGDALTVLKRGFVGALEQGERRFVFNFSNAPYVDSSTIGEVIACHKRASERDAAIKFVVPPTGRVRDVLRLTGLERIMEIHEEEDSAILAFAP